MMSALDLWTNVHRYPEPFATRYGSSRSLSVPAINSRTIARGVHVYGAATETALAEYLDRQG
jgi:hypothetical protein